MEDEPRIEVGYGVSQGTDAFATGAEAARQAMAGVVVHPLSAVLVFASVCYDLEALLQGIHDVVGEVQVLGTTTAGEICDSPRQQSTVVVALASPYLRVGVGVGQGVSKNWQQAVSQAVSVPEVQPFFSSQHENHWSALTRQGKAAFALLFSPGNTRHADSRSYEILEELKRLSQGRLPIFGGSSADDWRMEGNYVLLGQRAYADSTLVAVFETHLRFGIGLAHGFRPSHRRATITRTLGHEVLELDHEPADQAYARLLDRSPDTLEGQHLTLTTGRPAGTPDPYGQYSINVASYFTPQGGVRFSQPLPEGAALTIMEADRDDVISAGREALRKALLRGRIATPAVTLVCSCALRTRILGDRTGDEIASMKEMIPGAPLVGFYSFGEQGLTDDGVNRHNNEMVAVLTLGQRLSHAARVALENEQLREVLQEREERFRVLVESLDDVVFTLDREQRHTGVFGRWVERAGLTPETFLGKTAREILGDQAAAVHETANERALAGETVVYEWDVETADGTECYQTSLSPIRDSRGTIVGLACVGRDITARKQAEERIVQLNRLQEYLLTPHSLEVKLKRVTDSVVTIFGADFARIWITKPGDRCDLGCFHSRVTEGPHVCRSRDRCLHLVSSSGRYTHVDGEVHRRVPFGCYKIGLIAAGKEPRFITTDVTHDPNVHDHDWARKLGLVSFAGYQLLSATGEPLGVLALFSQRVISPEEDVLLESLANTTAQVIQTTRATEALRESEETARAILNATIDSAALLDLDGNHLALNRSMAQVLGRPVEELVGLCAYDLLPPDVAESRRARVEQVIRTGKPVRFEDKRAGRIIDNSIYPIFDAQGHVARLAIFGRDVTEHKQVEDEREKLIRELEDTLARVKTLRGLLPICASCKKIRDDKGYWTQVEVYVRDHSEVEFTHGLCPECIAKLYPNYRGDDAEGQGKEEMQNGSGP